VVQIGCFEKFLKMIFGWQSLVLEAAFGSLYALLVEVTGFLIADTVAGYYGDVMGSSLLPLLPALSTFLGTHGGALGGYSLATVSGRFCVP
jgi:hypothetical protein